MGGWASMSRDHLFYEDLDGDGSKVVVSEINGVWNRVTVWKSDGTPLYNAQFGPGEVIPARNMRGLDVADLNGDGKQEIITATSGGLVVALSCKCEKLWSRRMTSPPTVLKAVTPQAAAAPVILVGCEDGGVVVLDGKGQVIRRGQVKGAPTRIEEMLLEGGRKVVVVGTSQGQAVGLAP